MLAIDPTNTFLTSCLQASESIRPMSIVRSMSIVGTEAPRQCAPIGMATMVSFNQGDRTNMYSTAAHPVRTSYEHDAAKSNHPKQYS